MNKHYWFGLLLSLLSSIVLAAPLHDVAREGRVSQVKKLVGSGADVNSANYYGFTPLLLAKINDHNITAGWLESQGAETGLPALTETIQLYLQYLEFPVSEADGLLGTETRDAIRAFQRQQKLSVTGRIREPWVKRLHNKVQEKIQQQLKAQDIYTGPIDGLMGPSMRKALRTFQKQAGLTVNGRISKELLTKLSNNKPPTALVSTKPSDAGAIKSSIDLSTPTVDSDNPSPQLIRYLQVRLKTLGYDPGEIDGKMGTETEQAIRKFQTQSDLPVTGKISENWIARLNLEVLRKLGYSGAVDITKSKLAEQPASENKPKPESDPEPRQIATASVTEQEPSSKSTDTTDTTKTKTELSETDAKPKPFADDTISLAQLFRWEGDLDNLSPRFSTRLQSRLRTLAYDPGEIDGNIGPTTVKAIQEFQKKQGISATGRIDEGWLPLLETELIKLTQAKLSQLGFDPGPVDGAIGARTTTAIRDFQKQHSLPPTSLPSDFLISKLNDAVSAYNAAEQARAEKVRAQKVRAQKVRAQQAEQAARAQAEAEKARTTDRGQAQTAQANLQALGLYSGSIDGKIGSATRNAIKRFQRQVKLKADGELDKQVLNRLDSEIVKTVQARLQILGYQPGTVDGAMGTRTRNAIRKFQRANKLSVNGAATAALANRLQRAINARLATPKKTSSQQKVEAAKDEPKAATISEDVIETSLSTQTIAKLQSNLSVLGYDPGPADGKMGQKTANAIRQYQTRTGLSVNGEPSRFMLAKLNEEATKAAKSQPKAKRSSNTRSGATSTQTTTKSSKGGKTEVRGKLKFQRASNGSLLGCSIKGVQLDRAWCDPFAARRNTSDCKVILRSNSDVLLVKCS